MRLRVAFFIVVVCLSVAVFSCRRNQPSLVDSNRAPDTELWFSPPDSTEYDYLVHLYWRGVDNDGIATRYIWTITDTLLPNQLDWDPSSRVRDFRAGRITSRTDSVFSFTAFRNVGGVGLKKNRQAFHISAIDDNGVIDPSPARVEFVATVAKLPVIRFVTQSPPNPPATYDPNEIDTVGMFRPFQISYQGRTTNGLLRGYRFFPLTTGVTLAGQNVWTKDLTDTLQIFPNTGVDALPSGELRLAAQCVDDAGAESVVDAARFTQGVARVVVNFEPDTRIFSIINTYFKSTVAFTDTVRFDPNVPPGTPGHPDTPDTVPYGSWIKFSYNGWDDAEDVKLCMDPINKCIDYQIQYTRIGDQDGGPANGGSSISSTVRWLPDDPEDSNPGGTTDSTSMNVGSEKYIIRARSVDEYDKPDGTPAEAVLVGNFKPTLDTYSIERYDGTVIGPDDTLAFDWWNPANAPDTVDISNPLDPDVVKLFYFVVKGDGHDHPKEPTDAGIKSWFYLFRRADDPLILERFARSGSWVDGAVTNTFSDTFKVQYRYKLIGDPGGFKRLQTLQSFYNKSYTYSMRGRDLSSIERFEQIVWLLGTPVTQNAFNTSTLGRLTALRQHNFYFTMDY